MDVAGGNACQRGKIICAGSMIGSSIFYPLANAGGHWVPAITLSIFLISALTFHAIHVEPFKSCGLYTFPVALLVLFWAVFSSDSSRKDLIPWLPLFIVLTSLVTILVHGILTRFNQHPNPQRNEGNFTGVAVDGDDSNRSFRTRQSATRPPSRSLLWDNIFFAHHGPPSQRSDQFGSGQAAYDLDSVEELEEPRHYWDGETRGFFPQAGGNQETSDETAFGTSDQPARPEVGADDERISQNTGRASSDPLLSYSA